MIHRVVSEIWVFRMGSTILEHPVLLKRALEIGSASMIKLIAFMVYVEVANDNIVVLLFTWW